MKNDEENQLAPPFSLYVIQDRWGDRPAHFSPKKPKISS